MVDPLLQEGQARRPPRLDLIQALGSMRVLGVELGLDELQELGVAVITDISETCR